jgi:hypothetical protein
VRQLRGANIFEDSFADEAVKVFMQEVRTKDTECTLKYLAATNSCTVPAEMLGEGLRELVPIDSPRAKHMLSPDLSVVRKTVNQLKEEMMKRYEAGGYYFFEACIDGIMEV